MQEAHVSYEDLEKYMDDTDLSESYLCWSEQITEHLSDCMHCRERLDKMILLSELLKEENMAATVRLVGKEEELQRELADLRIGHKAKSFEVM